MHNDARWRQRFQNFDNAYGTFCRILKRYEAQREDEVVKVALVQAFEFTYELAWNTLKDYLENEGFDEVQSPKQTIRTAFKAGLIGEAERWMEMIQKRNLANHTYNAVILEETVAYIYDDFYPLVRKLHEDLKQRL